MSILADRIRAHFPSIKECSRSIGVNYVGLFRMTEKNRLSKRLYERLQSAGVDVSGLEGIARHPANSTYVDSDGNSTIQWRLLAGDAPAIAYGKQRAAAAQRGIEWQISFAEWWGLWQKSGKWEWRGKKGGCFVMARHGDIGPYAIDNVRIATTIENAADRRGRPIRRRTVGA